MRFFSESCDNIFNFYFMWCSDDFYFIVFIFCYECNMIRVIRIVVYMKDFVLNWFRFFIFLWYRSFYKVYDMKCLWMFFFFMLYGDMFSFRVLFWFFMVMFYIFVFEISWYRNVWYILRYFDEIILSFVFCYYVCWKGMEK